MPLNLIFIQPGNYTIEDNGIPGDNISVIKDGNGAVIFTFAHPVDSLGFTVSTPGVNLTINFTDSLGAANFTLGSLTNPAESPDSIVMRNVVTTGTVTLVANNAITEGGADVAADITAGALIMSAGSGIGTGGNAIETRTGLFEAETTTGGIAISNFGSVQIGGVSADVDGLDVVTSGDISFTTVGSIFLTEANSVTAAEVIHGGGTSGNVTLTANGANADIIGNVDNGAATAARGTIAFTAGRDIQLGTIGANFNNDIVANSSVIFNAGRDILIDGFADVLSDNFGLDTGGNVAFTAGRNIGILQVAGTSASVTASGAGGGDITMTTGAGGSLTVNGPGSFALGSTSGNVIVNADRILIDGASGISSSTGTVILRPVTAGRAMHLGSASDAALAVELSDVELNRVFTPDLVIGGTQTGPIRVIGAIAPVSPGNAPSITMRSTTNISIEAAVTTLGALALRAGDDIVKFNAANISAGGVFSAFVDQAGDDEGTGGLGALNGSVTATSIALSGNGEADILRGAEGVDQTVHGNGGNDRIFSSGEGHYFGDEGDDTILAGLSSGLVPEVLDGGNGIDTLDTTSFSGSYVINLATGVSNFGFESFLNFENVTTAGGADTLTGTAGANTIRSGSGIDILDGAGGADTLIGEDGDDQYRVDNAGDVVVETAGQGVNDRVFASVSYTLGAGVQVEMLTTNDNLATTAINLTGNELVNTIFGNAGANILDGKAGADSMIGFGGDDWFFVDNAADSVNEGAGGGLNDRVFASVSYTLGAGAQVEILSTSDNLATTAINLTGNELVNIIFGNAGANILDGKAGVDSLIGFGGDDWFFVDNAADSVNEGAGGGLNDRISASVSYTLAAGVQVEILSTSDNLATTAINLTGNELVNTIFGNAGANILDGKAGADSMIGFGGDDRYFVDNIADSVNEGAGGGTLDRVLASVSYVLAAGVQVEMMTTVDNFAATAINLRGNELGNAIFGNAGINVLDGGGGMDSLTGFGGADTFRFTSALGAGNVDSISDYNVADDGIQLDDAVFAGLATGALAAGAFRTGAAAADADDRIIYNSATGALLFDADGVGGAAAVQFATIAPGLAMAASEFFVI